LEICCEANGRIEKQNQQSCVRWGKRLQRSKQKCLEGSFPGQVGEGSLGRASKLVSASSATCRKKTRAASFYLSASAVVLPQQESRLGGEHVEAMGHREGGGMALAPSLLAHSGKM